MSEIVDISGLKLSEIQVRSLWAGVTAIGKAAGEFPIPGVVSQNEHRVVTMTWDRGQYVLTLTLAPDGDIWTEIATTDARVRGVGDYTLFAQILEFQIKLQEMFRV